MSAGITNRKRINANSARYRGTHREEINAKSRAEYARTAEYRKDWFLMFNFGITRAEYDAILDSQGGVCAVCLQPPGKRRLAVEHEHAPDGSDAKGVSRRPRITGLVHSGGCNTGIMEAARAMIADRSLFARVIRLIDTKPAQQFLKP